MKETQEKPTGLPENAFRPLKPGEKYVSILFSALTHIIHKPTFAP